MGKVEYDSKYFKKKYFKLRKWETKIGKDIVKRFAIKSILDLGCGIGSFLSGAVLVGCEDVIGIELNYENSKKYIVKNIFPYIKYGDITKDINLKRQFDCVISIEVAEHLSPGETDSFIKNLVYYSRKYIIFSAAAPGQPGRGHINLRKRSLWIRDIVSHGVVVRKDLVKECRRKWRKLGSPGYLLENLIIFEKEV